MSSIRIGNMFHSTAENADFFVTTNNVIKSNGTLTMGSGVAKESVTLWPELPEVFGNHLKLNFKKGQRYYLIPPVKVTVPGNKFKSKYSWKVGGLQTKDHWRDDSPYDLILASLQHLNAYAVQNRDSNREINCVMPGIGKGGLDFWLVAGLVYQVLDPINFWISLDYVRSMHV